MLKRNKSGGVYNLKKKHEKRIQQIIIALGIIVLWKFPAWGEPSVLWDKALGGSEADYAAAIQQTNDGGYIVAGSSWSNDGDVSGNHGESDFWVVKLNKERERWKCIRQPWRYRLLDCKTERRWDVTVPFYHM
jgi:hypothetical protein